MLQRECNKLMKKMDFDDRGQIAFDAKTLKHMAGCPDCKDFYKRLIAGEKVDIPISLSDVMEEIKSRRADKASRKRSEHLRELWPRVAVFATTIIVIGVIAFSFVLYSLINIDKSEDSYLNMVRIEKSEGLANVENTKEQKSAELDKLTRKLTRLYESDNT